MVYEAIRVSPRFTAMTVRTVTATPIAPHTIGPNRW